MKETERRQIEEQRRIEEARRLEEEKKAKEIEAKDMQRRDVTDPIKLWRTSRIVNGDQKTDFIRLHIKKLTRVPPKLLFRASDDGWT
jgi:uncharacterized membrane protein